MKNKIIFWGSVQEGEKIHLVSWDGETGSQYHNLNGTLIEYVVVASLEQLREEMITKKPVIFCMEHIRELDWNVISKKCQKVLYLPQMAKLNLDELMSTALFSNKVNLVSKKLMFAGWVEHSEQIGMEILRNFEFVERANSIQVILGGSSELDVKELSPIEDVMKEYAQKGSTFYIDQVMLDKKQAGYYFILHIES